MSLDECAATAIQVGQEVSALYAAIRHRRQFDREKHVIFVNDGTIRTGGLMTMNPLLQACGTCRTRVDPNRLGRVSDAQLVADQVVRNIAAMMGGVTIEYGSASALLEGIDRAFGFEYLLGYAPTNTTWDRRERRIRISVTRKDARVLYRQGYYASHAEPPAARFCSAIRASPRPAA